jgi:hypothetical protein
MTIVRREPGEAKAVPFVEVDQLLRLGVFVWIAADPVNHVMPTAHAAAFFVLSPQGEIPCHVAVVPVVLKRD